MYLGHAPYEMRLVVGGRAPRGDILRFLTGKEEPDCLHSVDLFEIAMI